MNNSTRVSPREYATWELVARGKTNAEIADILGVKESTVKQYVQGLFYKLELDNRVQLALEFYAVDWRTEPGMVRSKME